MTGLVAFSGHTFAGTRVTAGCTAFTTTHRVIDRVHDDTAVARTATEPAAAACLAGHLEAVVPVGDDADGGLACAEDHAGFARRQFDDGIAAVTGHQLRVGTGAAGDFAALTGTHLDVVDDGTEGNLANREAVAKIGGDTRAADDLLTHLDAVRRHDVALLAVGVEQQGDACRAVRIVLNGLYGGRNTIFVSLEIYETIHLLMTATAVPYRHLTTVIAAAGAVFRAQEALFGLARGNVIVSANHFEALTRRYWFVLF